MFALILGDIEGYMSTVAKVLMQKGVHVIHEAQEESFFKHLKSLKKLAVILVDATQDIALTKRIVKEKKTVPLIFCGQDPSKSKKTMQALQESIEGYIRIPQELYLLHDVLKPLLFPFSRPVYSDPQTSHVFSLAKKIASSDATVLITGPSGTGKEVVAHYIHHHSKRYGQKFVSVNCAAIPNDLLESELFGHEKGAFTGALYKKNGKFEEAQGGTLLLDEISEMHPRLQAKLLRALQEREIDRVGGSAPIKIDVRFLATTNRNLHQAIKQGTFREDLFFRLNVVTIDMPPLACRTQDVPPLANHFIKKYSKSYDLSPKHLSPKALTALTEHAWPGNVRELENTLHRAVLFCEDEEILPKHLFLHTPRSKKNPKEFQEWSSRTLVEAEKNLIFQTLAFCGGNMKESASLLGISQSSLENKLKHYEHHLHLKNFFQKTSSLLA